MWQYPWPPATPGLFDPRPKEHFCQEPQKQPQRGLEMNQLDLLSWVPLVLILQALFSESAFLPTTQPLSPTPTSKIPFFFF